MGAIFLRDLADKTRRGLAGRVARGRIVGRVAYGYDRISGQLTAKGEVERGLLQQNPAEAAVVHRLPDLRGWGEPDGDRRRAQRRGHALADGGKWTEATLRGKPARGTGLLRNPIYVGRLVWNRHRSPRDPDTGKRVRRRNAAEDVVEAEVPALRIVEPELWAAVQARLEANRAPQQEERGPRFWERRRAQYLLSGKVVCGVCGRTYKAIGRDYLACTAAKVGACTNRARVPRGPLEAEVCEALGRELMDPGLAAEGARGGPGPGRPGGRHALGRRGRPARDRAGRRVRRDAGAGGAVLPSRTRSPGEAGGRVPLSCSVKREPARAEPSLGLLFRR